MHDLLSGLAALYHARPEFYYLASIVGATFLALVLLLVLSAPMLEEHTETGSPERER